MLKLLYKLVFVCYTVCSLKFSFSLNIHDTGVCHVLQREGNYELRCCQNYRLLPDAQECIDCPNGTFGHECAETCDVNYYGLRCLYKCYCFDNETCNMATGCEEIINVNSRTIAPVFVNRESQSPANSTKLKFDRINISDLCIKITAAGAVSFATIVIFLLIIIFIQRRKLVKASFTSLTARRDQNTYNEIPPEMSDSITGQYYEVSPLSEISATGGKPTVQQNIEQIQHIDTSGYLIPSGMLETGGDYQTVAD